MSPERARARLEQLAQRIERVAVDPRTVPASKLVRLVRPILARLGRQAPASIAATTALVRAIGARARFEPDDGAELDHLLGAAIDELEANVAGVERMTHAEQRVHVSHAAWLRRLYEVLSRAVAATEDLADRDLLELAGGVDPVVILPPLAVRAREDEDRVEDSEDEEPADEPATRLLALQVDAVDRLLEAARDEGQVLGRRRRLLEAARRLLIESDAALPLDPAGVEPRLRAIAREVTRLNRLQAAGVSPEIGLLHQAQSALARGERDRLYATLRAMHEGAVRRGDGAVAARARSALERLAPGHDAHHPDRIAASRARSAEQILGEDAIAAIREGHQPQLRRTIRTEDNVAGSARATALATIAVDGCFDLGGAVTPVRVTELEVRIQAVRHPTTELTFVPAEGPEDLAAAVIDDPRTLLLSLASGRLLTRRYLREVTAPRKRTVMRGEARVYVLDGSGSMLGRRAQMRDAILVAELATLAERLETPDRHTRVALYYRYFNEYVGPTRRVADRETALREIEHVLRTTQTGGTDILAAVLASLEDVRRAREQDGELSRAQIVLVTDGEAAVDERSIVRKRREIAADVSLGISVIAIGQENAALRRIVARQRARGERAFYHFISDEMLEELAERGEIDRGPALHPPPLELPAGGGAALVEHLEAGAGELLEELAAITRERDAELLGAATSPLGEGARARVELMLSDERRLGARFARWFPEPPVGAAAGAEPSADRDVVLALLATITEVVDLIEGTELARRADAIDLLERLLPDARLTPARYAAVVSEWTAETADAMRALHAAARWGMLRKIR